MRDYRDNVLSKSPHGQKLIEQYYKWNPVMVEVMESNESVKKIMRTVIDGLMPLIELQAE